MLGTAFARMSHPAEQLNHGTAKIIDLILYGGRKSNQRSEQ